MTYDEQLAERIRHCLAGEDAVTEKRMFGGLAFLVAGNMAVAAANEAGQLMVRIDPAEAGELTAADGVRPKEMRGRSLSGWLEVDASALVTTNDLERWVDVGLARARTLPPK